jgi:hypothetical protein
VRSLNDALDKRGVASVESLRPLSRELCQDVRVHRRNRLLRAVDELTYAPCSCCFQQLQIQQRSFDDDYTNHRPTACPGVTRNNDDARFQEDVGFSGKSMA